MPYKQKIIPFIDRLINDAQLTNSVNTIFLDDTNSLVGENTDVFGLQAAYLKEIINAEKNPAITPEIKELVIILIKLGKFHQEI